MSNTTCYLPQLLNTTSLFSFKVHEFRLQLNPVDFFPSLASPALQVNLLHISSIHLLRYLPWALNMLHSPIWDTTTGIFALTSPFCLASQSVSLHWLLPSCNTSHLHSQSLVSSLTTAILNNKQPLMATSVPSLLVPSTTCLWKGSSETSTNQPRDSPRPLLDRNPPLPPVQRSGCHTTH